jgi:hypothetical protein
MVMPSDEQLDDAIDRAVREMMDVDPPAGLRARVLARLDAPGHPWRPARLLAGAAAVAIALLALLQPWRQAPEPEPRLATASPGQPPAVAPQQPPQPAPPPSVQPGPATPRRSPGGVTRPATSDSRERLRTRLDDEIVAANAPVEPDAGPMPLAPLPGIDVGRIAPEHLETAAVSLSPLPSPRWLQIDPLPTPGGQN